MPQATLDPTAESTTEEAKTPDHLRGHVAECRGGDFSGLDCLSEALVKGKISPLEIGTTDGEIHEFREARITQDNELAVQYLAEARAGNFENFAKFVGILDRQTTAQLRLELLDEEYFALIRLHNVQASRQIVEDCRGGDFGKLAELIVVLEKRRVLFEEIDTTPEEVMSFVAAEGVQAGKRVVKQCRDGDFGKLIPLLVDLRKGTFTEAEVGTTPEEVKRFASAGIGEALNLIAAECRSGNYRNAGTLKSALKALPDQDLAGIDFDTEEVERWERLAELTGVQINRSTTGLITL